MKLIEKRETPNPVEALTAVTKCVRRSWDVVSTGLTGVWGSGSDRRCIDLVDQLYPKPVYDVSERSVGGHLSSQVERQRYAKLHPIWMHKAVLCLPTVLALEHSKNFVLLKRNFWHDKDPMCVDYPINFGEFLSGKDRDIVRRFYGITRLHRDMFLIGDDRDDLNSALWHIAATCALTTYTIPLPISLSELCKLSANQQERYDASTVHDYMNIPILVVTDFIGTFRDLEKTSGYLRTFLNERSRKGNVTLYADVVPQLDRKSLSDVQDYATYFRQRSSLDALGLLPILLGPSCRRATTSVLSS